MPCIQIPVQQSHHRPLAILPPAHTIHTTLTIIASSLLSAWPAVSYSYLLSPTLLPHTHTRAPHVGSCEPSFTLSLSNVPSLALPQHFVFTSITARSSDSCHTVGEGAREPGTLTVPFWRVFQHRLQHLKYIREQGLLMGRLWRSPIRLQHDADGGSYGKWYHSALASFFPCVLCTPPDAWSLSPWVALLMFMLHHLQYHKHVRIIIISVNYYASPFHLSFS